MRKFKFSLHSLLKYKEIEKNKVISQLSPIFQKNNHLQQNIDKAENLLAVSENLNLNLKLRKNYYEIINSSKNFKKKIKKEFHEAQNKVKNIMNETLVLENLKNKEHHDFKKKQVYKNNKELDEYVKNLFINRNKL